MFLGTILAGANNAVPSHSPAPFEILTRRVDVDVDGAPNAYGPPGSHALDSLKHAHYRNRQSAGIVGYLTEDDHPNVPVLQNAKDPYPGLYISQTAYTDPGKSDERDVFRYVDATRISYVVLGDEAKRRGAVLGDFVAVHSLTTGRSGFAIVGDDGNPSGDEGSLHLLQALGYPFHDGVHDAVGRPEIIFRFYPHSNPHHLFFRSQTALDGAAERLGLSCDFNANPRSHLRHPNFGTN